MASFEEDANAKLGVTSDALNPDIISEFSYKFDTFQEEACLSLEKGQHVLCLAHTSAGKSTIALYAIAKAILEDKRLIYTAPVKSLSNQKYAELKKKYGDERVGLATGDNKINIDADILVMTTEILRNMLSKPTWNSGGMEGTTGTTGSVIGCEEEEAEATNKNEGEEASKLESEDSRLSYVVFDEAHYINDRSRGNVYEECIMKLPSRVQMIFLSATMANPEHFCNWVQHIKPDRALGVSATSTRPVPLRFHIFVPNPETFEESMPWADALKEGHLAVMLNGEHGKFQNDLYLSMVKRYNSVVNFKTIKIKEERERLDGATAAPADAAAAQGASKKAPTTKVVKRTIPLHMIGMLNKFINFLSINDQLPAIFFTLSRKKCNALARHVESTLVSHTERREIENIFDYHIRGLEDASQYRQVSEVRALLMKGVGVHHSGMLTLLKEIVEIIFTKGLIKVMFATETLAIGVNTPTRTTLFTDVLKFDGYSSHKRVLSIEEFKQMAGRAGRRGLDTVGNVVYFPVDTPLLLPEMLSMLSGPLRVLSSNFTVTTQYVLRLLKSTEQPTEVSMLESTRKSLLSIEMQMHYRQKEEECSDLLGQLDTLRASIKKVLDKSDALMELSRLEKQLATEKLGQGATKKLKQKIGSALANLSKQEQSEQTKVAELVRQEGLIEQSLQLVQEDILSAPDAEIKIQLKSCIQFLASAHFVFIEDEKAAATSTMRLTQQGLFASCITQCNEIVLTRAIFMGLGDDLRHDPALLCAWLATFVGTEQDETKGDGGGGGGGGGDTAGSTLSSEALPENLLTACNAAMELAVSVFEEMTHAFFIAPDKPGQPAAKQLHPLFTAPMFAWAQKQEHFESICMNFGFYEGNFVRSLQKMVNLFNELLLAFEITNWPEWVNCIQRCKEEFTHGILLVESIYL